MGKIEKAYYRVVVVDSRKKRDAKVIEDIGNYHPKEEPSFIEVTSDQAQYWLGVGAQPSETVEALLKVTGDLQKFKGLQNAEGDFKLGSKQADVPQAKERTEFVIDALGSAAALARLLHVGRSQPSRWRRGD